MYKEVQARLNSCPRTWLITGAAGSIGSDLLESRLKLNQRAIGLNNLSFGRRSNLPKEMDAVSRIHWRSAISPEKAKGVQP